MQSLNLTGLRNDVGARFKQIRAMRWFPLYVLVSSAVLLVAAAIAALQITREVMHVPQVSLATLSDSKAGIAIYDRYNRFICTVQPRDREPVPLSKISINMRNALVAIEDHNFYGHHGLDFGGIARAAYKNWNAGHTVEGASTITQQLARNVCSRLDKDDRSISRKVREAYVAWDIENEYSKPKILESYLNEVYFGGGAHGIERAASRFFNKHASELTVSESAFLAGLLKSPGTLSTPAKREIAMQRRDEVIDAMARYGFIGTAQAEREKQVKLVFKSGPHKLRYPHYVAYVLEVLEKELGDRMWTGDYKVYTHLDPGAQQLAEKTLNEGIKTAPKGIDQAALVSMSLSDGGVLAMVGGVGGYQANEWNRAVHPHTAGSSFKPFVYLTGLINGVLKQDSLIADTPLALANEGGAPYSPKNFDGRFLGWMPVRDALCLSRNVCSVRVAEQAGLNNIIDTARSAGLGAQMDPYPSLALGSCAVSPLDMATGYATIARAGVRMEPQFLRQINTSDRVLRTFAATPSSNLPAENCAQVRDMMQDVVQRGTGTAARLPGIAVAGKTGTADKGRDLWFVGCTPETVTAVWGGNDMNQPVRGTQATGGTVMATMWHSYMTKFHQTHKPTVVAFAPPLVPMMTGIPVYQDTDLEAGLDFQGMLTARIVPSSMVARIETSTLSPQFNSTLTAPGATGIISAIDLERYEAAARRQIAQLQLDSANAANAASGNYEEMTGYVGMSRYAGTANNAAAAGDGIPTAEAAHGSASNVPGNTNNGISGPVGYTGSGARDGATQISDSGSVVPAATAPPVLSGSSGVVQYY